MDKRIGYNRSIRLRWLETAAALCLETRGPVEIRTRLRAELSEEIASEANQRKTADILAKTWEDNDPATSNLRDEALARFQADTTGEGHLWLHYGLTLLRYPFFRQVVVALGQLARTGNEVSVAAAKRRVVAERGELGSVDKAVERVFHSLSDWGLLARHEGGRDPVAQRQALGAESVALQAWLLACALRAHPSEELPFPDLLRLPELFPFRFTLSLDDLRQRPRFAVQRQGGGMDMVRLVP